MKAVYHFHGSHKGIFDRKKYELAIPEYSILPFKGSDSVFLSPRKTWAKDGRIIYEYDSLAVFPDLPAVQGIPGTGTKAEFLEAPMIDYCKIKVPHSMEECVQGFGREVDLVGMGEYIEVWDPRALDFLIGQMEPDEVIRDFYRAVRSP